MSQGYKRIKKYIMVHLTESQKGQSISIIYQNHKDEIMISENTVRNYLKRSLLKSNQLDIICK